MKSKKTISATDPVVEDTAPIEDTAAPVAPVESAPVESAPVEPAPVEGLPGAMFELVPVGLAPKMQVDPSDITSVQSRTTNMAQTTVSFRDGRSVIVWGTPAEIEAKAGREFEKGTD
jgi:hypothetical protein